MTFFQLVRREMEGSMPRLVFMSGLGGISNAAILAAVNAGAKRPERATSACGRRGCSSSRCFFSSRRSITS